MLIGSLGIRLIMWLGAAVPLPPPPGLLQALTDVTVTNDADGDDGFQLTLSIGTFIISYLPLPVAESKGLFRNQGLDVTVVGILRDVRPGADELDLPSGKVRGELGGDTSAFQALIGDEQYAFQPQRCKVIADFAGGANTEFVRRRAHREYDVFH